MELPRSIADSIALVRDLLTHPREVLLVRRHHQWVGAAYVAALSAPALLFDARPSPGTAAVAIAPGVASWLLDVAGLFAHVAWQRGRIWQDVTCDCCDGPDDDGRDDDQPGPPDGPDGDDGLVVQIEQWLRTGSDLSRPAA